MALAAYIAEGPPPMYTESARVSSTSARVAPSFTRVRMWKAMQPSQRTAMPMARAINSLVFSSSAPVTRAARPSSWKAFITAGWPLRSGERLAEISVASWA